MFEYEPRDVFSAFHERVNRFGVIVAHRRAGKTVACVNDLIMNAVSTKKKKARFSYIAPHYNMAKDIAWDYLKSYSAPFLKQGGTVNEAELRIDYHNGARIRLYGADNVNRLRGIYHDGIILDEYADMNPNIWEVVRPALSDREGWCVWIGTPRGHNDFYRVYEQAVKDGWFHTTLKASKTLILDTKELESAEHDLTEDQYAQEYECSFEAAIQGAYYGEEMKEAEDEKRITFIHYEKDHEVHTSWDLGIGDSTAIWFIQMIGNELRLIDYYEASGVGLDHYVKILKDKPYNYGTHVLPHDVEVTELGTGKSRLEVLRNLGIEPKVAEKLSLEDGIQATRSILNRCWFDKQKCERGIEALKQYRRTFDDKNKAFKNRPLHDWTSHAADSFRYMAIGLKRRHKYKELEFNTSWIA